jgi:hypothetical protein
MANGKWQMAKPGQNTAGSAATAPPEGKTFDIYHFPFTI